MYLSHFQGRTAVCGGIPKLALNWLTWVPIADMRELSTGHTFCWSVRVTGQFAFNELHVVTATLLSVPEQTSLKVLQPQCVDTCLTAG